MSELRVDLDRDVKLDARGVPTCDSGGRLRSIRGPKEFDEVCGAAEIGEGRVNVEVAFGDQIPLTTTTRVRVGNGGYRDGLLTLYAYMYFEAPITGSIVATAKVRPKTHGRYGSRMIAKFPEIARGAGSIRVLRLTLSRRIVSASCTDKRLEFAGTARFYDDERTDTSTVKRTCRPQNQSKRHSSHRRRYL